MDIHPVKALLNVQLASDSSAVIHLPYILQIINADYFLPSPHLQKWSLRITSLLHSKEAGAKWAGLCLAHGTSLYSKSVMIECAQSWLGIALPILTRKESSPMLKAALNLCRVIFTSAVDTPEFQRQVSSPNVPKFNAALIYCLENSLDLELKVLALKTLTRLIPIYPNVHRANHTSLSAIVLRILAEQSNHATKILTEPASKLYSVLHLTGGKVGAATLWRKAVDERVASAWTALSALRTTFPASVDQNQQQTPIETDDPSIWTLLNINRLHSSVLAICDLLRTTTSRPVQVPIGPLTRLATALITVTGDEQSEGHFDPTVRAMEVALIPKIWRIACELTSCLAKAIAMHFDPYLTRFCTYIAFHLEQSLKSPERRLFLTTLRTLLTHSHPLDSSILSTRITRAVLLTLSSILPSQSDPERGDDAQGTSVRSKKGKKRARGYEGDEVFRSSLSVICPTVDDGRVILMACDVMQKLLQISEVSPALHSMACRVILSVMLHLPQMSPSLVSADVQMYHELVKRIRDLALELSEGTTSAMGKSLGLVVHALSTAGFDESSLHELDILLHPRLPPLLRSLPQVEAFSLFRTEESEEEMSSRQGLGLEVEAGEEPPPPTRLDDTVMGDARSTPVVPTAPIEPTPKSIVHPPPQTIPAVIPDLTPKLSITNPIAAANVIEKQPDATVVSMVKNSMIKTLPDQGPRISQAKTIIRSSVDAEDEDMPAIDLESDSDSD
ncbi:ribosome biogenesis protein rix1 [Moniliophthora roreri]|nr:ribosome biogenesis protein rix1 [Moniliophthora roreri]